jgi:hypothetical protein
VSCSAQKQRPRTGMDGCRAGGGGAGLSRAQAPNDNPNRESPQFQVPQHCIPPTDGYLPSLRSPSFHFTHVTLTVLHPTLLCAQRPRPSRCRLRVRERGRPPTPTKYNRRVRKSAACAPTPRPRYSPKSTAAQPVHPYLDWVR